MLFYLEQIKNSYHCTLCPCIGVPVFNREVFPPREPAFLD